MLFVVGNGRGDSAIEGCAGLETETFLRARHVEAAPRLAVGLAGVPDEAAFIARRLRDLRGQVPDRDLLAAAQVDGVARVVALGREQDALGGVVDVQELA